MQALEVKTPKNGHEAGQEMKIDFRGGQGMVVLKSDRIDSFGAWLRSQVVGFNVANVALLIAVVVVGAQINETLNTQREQNAVAQKLLDQMVQERQTAQVAVKTLDDQLKSSGQLAGTLNTSIDDLAAKLLKYNETAVLFNTTLSQAISLGLPNLTDSTARQQIQALETKQSNLNSTMTRFSAFAAANSSNAADIAALQGLQGAAYDFRGFSQHPQLAVPAIGQTWRVLDYMSPYTFTLTRNALVTSILVCFATVINETLDQRWFELLHCLTMLQLEETLEVGCTQDQQSQIRPRRQSRRLV